MRTKRTCQTILGADPNPTLRVPPNNTCDTSIDDTYTCHYCRNNTIRVASLSYARKLAPTS